MLIGYVRVSTSDQNLDLQMDALKTVGCDKVHKDIASGAKDDRRGLLDVLTDLRKGDTLVVWKLDRLGRSLRNLIDTINQINSQGCYFRSLQENIDTNTSGGKLIFHIFGALAEFERDIIRDRTKAGLAAARKRGNTGGRPKKMDDKKIVLARTLITDKSNSINEICDMLKVSRATLYRYLKKE
ncbi:MAG: recombinase family protein [Planctomycetia bacterium]|nr:recombinase family protein [Planctomycetia bacterium]